MESRRYGRVGNEVGNTEYVTANSMRWGTHVYEGFVSGEAGDAACFPKNAGWRGVGIDEYEVPSVQRRQNSQQYEIYIHSKGDPLL